MVNDVVSDLTSGLGEFCLRFFSGWLGGFLVGGRCPEAASVRALGCGRTLYLASSPTPCLTPVGLLLLLLVRRLCAVAAFVCLFVCLPCASFSSSSLGLSTLPSSDPLPAPPPTASFCPLPVLSQQPLERILTLINIYIFICVPCVLLLLLLFFSG